MLSEEYIQLNCLLRVRLISNKKIKNQRKATLFPQNFKKDFTGFLFFLFYFSFSVPTFFFSFFLQFSPLFLLFLLFLSLSSLPAGVLWFISHYIFCVLQFSLSFFLEKNEDVIILLFLLSHTTNSRPTHSLHCFHPLSFVLFSHWTNG
jgi:signal transduction histidine kinase